MNPHHSKISQTTNNLPGILFPRFYQSVLPGPNHSPKESYWTFGPKEDPLAPRQMNYRYRNEWSLLSVRPFSLSLPGSVNVKADNPAYL